MKNFLLITCIIVMGFSVVAQEETDSQISSKKEKKEKFLLPEKGEWAIGTDFVPILRTLGTVFWGESEPMGFQGTPYPFSYKNANPNVSLMVKYMAGKKCAIRANLGIGIHSFTSVSDSIPDDAAIMNDATSNAKVVDKMTGNKYSVNLSLGAEYRVGKKRIQGIFGGDLLFGIAGGSNTYKFGNEMTEDNQTPTSFSQTVYTNTHTSPYSRILSSKYDGAIAVGLQLTTGVEVFVAPKISLGGQVNLSYVFMYNSRNTIKYEGYNGDTQQVEKGKEKRTQPTWSHDFSTNNVGASLYMLFYF
ncbi:MAG: hypothetical protein FWH59_01085 [Lentimicrobiaceae bacterium]|nr:hypothetical protein [Lentimicrobiaceae bacterium]